MAQRHAYRIEPAPLRAVRLDGGFWRDRVEVNRTVTIPVVQARMGKRRWPSPSWLEAAAHSLHSHPSRALRRALEKAVDAIAEARQPDGFIDGARKPAAPRGRWANLRDNHRLYGVGLTTEAAVAYHEATGDRRFLDIMCKCVDAVIAMFGRGKGQIRGYPGHEAIEIALPKLYAATGERRYLDLAKFFVDERGRKPHIFDIQTRARGEDPAAWVYKTHEYSQSHERVRKQHDAVGHAVRATYLYAGMTDLAVLTGDRTLMRACKRIWKSVTGRRMHITGGIGPSRTNEGFTFDYDLPNEGAYLETCASIGLVFWAHRMAHAERDGRYADVMERALYNGVISGVALDGRTFFYGNPLATHPGIDGNASFVHRGFHYRRSEWFSCACCPPNISRLVAQMPRFVYSRGRAEVYVHLYNESSAELDDVAGGTLRIVQRTDYPWKEKVVLSVRPERPAAFALCLRIPDWCRKPRLKVNGRPVGVAGVARKGYARITRAWKKGDRVELVLPMPIERIEAHPAARHNRGRIALQRGPLVYCLEEVDNGANLNDIVLPRSARLVAKRDGRLPGNPVVITGQAKRSRLDNWKNVLFRPAGAGNGAAVATSIKAVPYFMWANRRPGEMLVWMRDG
jgi:DUF1680 family protein